MRVFLGLFWACVLFVCTCTGKVVALLKYRFVSFSFTKHPPWSDLLITSDINLHNKMYLIQKIGHFSGFFILSLILTDLGRHKSGVYSSICYAIFTEILQLFFYRDGRIVDMFIDTSGILLALWLCHVIPNTKRSNRFP